MRRRRKPVRGSRRGPGRPAPVERGVAGGERDLEGADELGDVVRMDAVRRRRDRGGARRRWSSSAVAMVVFGGVVLRRSVLAGRGVKESSVQGAEVEAGSAGDDGEVVARRRYRARDGAGITGVVAGGVGLVGVGDVDEVVRREGSFGRGGLGGTEVEAAVDGDRVATDDFAGEALGEGEGKGGFAAGGGAGEDDERRELPGFGEVYQSRHQPAVKTRCTPARRMAKTMAARARRSRPRSWLAAFELFGCAGRLCFARVGGVGMGA